MAVMWGVRVMGTWWVHSQGAGGGPGGWDLCVCLWEGGGSIVWYVCQGAYQCLKRS